MAKITQFTKQNLPQVRADLNKILKDYADKNGMVITLGNIKFQAGEFTTKLETKIVGAVTQEDKNLERYMATYSLGKFGTAGRELVGMNTRAHAYPFIYTQGGKRFKCSIENAKMYFATK